MDYNNGGARYQWSIINFAGLINVVDSMLVIRDFVFENKELPAQKLIALLSSDDEQFLEKAKKHSVCFGNDNADANAFSARISTDIYSMLEDKIPSIGDGFLTASIQFISQVDAGKKIGATPDGRNAGAEF